MRFHRWLLLSLAWALPCSGPGLRAAEESSLPVSKPAVRREVVAVIEAQLAAFREAHPIQAFTLAAAPLQLRMTLDQFVLLVRSGYPEIWTNARAEFGLVRDNGERAWLEVRIFPVSGSSAVYEYLLLKEEAGWRIGGVLRKEAKKQDQA